jgi:glycerol-3-phosphate O-acyltransferase
MANYNANKWCQVIASLYPYLKSELFLTWDLAEIEGLVNQHIDALIETHFN